MEKPAWTGTSSTMFSAYQRITQVGEKEIQGRKADFFFFLESQTFLDTDVVLSIEEAVLECLCAHTVCCSSDNICFRHLPWRPLAVLVPCIKSHNFCLGS